MDRLDEKTWDELLENLRQRRLASGSIHKAIVRLGKPYDEKRILKAKEVVAGYLNDADPCVRHEAVWFLASWGRLFEYEPQVIQMMLHDPLEDNRGYAANCVGVLRARHGGRHTLEVLRTVVLNEQEVEQVRVKAYAAMRKVAGAPISSADLFGFEIGEKHVEDIDWNWVHTSSISDFC